MVRYYRKLPPDHPNALARKTPFRRDWFGPSMTELDWHLFYIWDHVSAEEWRGLQTINKLLDPSRLRMQSDINAHLFPDRIEDVAAALEHLVATGWVEVLDLDN